MKLPTKEETIAERKAMPVLGQGTFIPVGKIFTLPIVKMGKRDITLRADDCGLITLNRKFIEVQKPFRDEPFLSDHIRRVGNLRSIFDIYRRWSLAGPGHTINSCRRCSRHLTNSRSIKHGYGPICYRKRMSGDPKTARQMDPCTITDKDMAQKVYAAIYRLIQNLDDFQLSWGKMLTGEDILTLPLESMDTDNELVLPGFGKPQWFYLHTEKYDLAIWKIGITTDLIRSDMILHGDIPC